MNVLQIMGTNELLHLFYGIWQAIALKDNG